MNNFGESMTRELSLKGAILAYSVGQSLPNLTVILSAQKDAVRTFKPIDENKYTDSQINGLSTKIQVFTINNADVKLSD